MKVLWVSGRLIGPAASIVNSDYNGTSGGWIQTEYEELDKSDIELFYLAGVKSVDVPSKASEKGTVYCVALPRVSSGINAPQSLVDEVKKIIDEISPDIIHLWGTETCLHDAVVKAAVNIPKVVYIQGLIGMHNRYRGGYINISDPSYSRSVPITKKAEQYIRRVAFKKQIEIEKRVLMSCGNVILDNEFSRAYCYSISPEIKGYNRRLNANGCFREKIWHIDSAERNTIFTVYGGSPDKGLHQLIKALRIVKNEYPDVLLRIPGPFSLGKNGEMKSAGCSSYEKWISKYISDNGLGKNVEFIGPKTQKDMAELAQKSHIFVNPSCMEVHALSLREAMTVGTPCISSLCGSVAEFLRNGENGILYRYEEQEVLAYDILKLLKNDDLSSELGKNAREDMLGYADSLNSVPLANIYKEIIKGYEI